MEESGTEPKEAVTTEPVKKQPVVHIPMAFALPQYTDMKEDMLSEALETCITACEKYPDNLEQAAQLISEEMVQKFCGHWHVVVGEAFGFEVTHEIEKVLYTYFGGNLGVLVWSN